MSYSFYTKNPAMKRPLFKIYPLIFVFYALNAKNRLQNHLLQSVFLLIFVHHIGIGKGSSDGITEQIIPGRFQIGE